MSHNDFDFSKKKDFIKKEDYTKEVKRYKKFHDGYQGIDVIKEENVQYYDRQAHEQAIRKALSQAFKDNKKKKTIKDLKVEIQPGETYKGIPIEELSPYMKLYYASCKIYGEDSDSNLSDI